MALDRPWAEPSSSVGARGRATTEGEDGAWGMDGVTECPERRDVTKQQPMRKLKIQTPLKEQSSTQVQSSKIKHEMR